MSLERLRKRTENRLDHAHASGQAIGPILGDATIQALDLAQSGRVDALDVQDFVDHLARYTVPMRERVPSRYSSRPPPTPRLHYGRGRR